MNTSDDQNSQQVIETVAQECVKSGGAEYKEYHAQFCKKGILEKLWLIALALPMHLFYKYIAAPDTRFTYTALLSYLGRAVNSTEAT